MNNAYGEIFVGHTIKGGHDISITNSQRSGHVQIVGATGRGKTQSVIIPWICRDLVEGHKPLLIDGKGDKEIATVIKKVMHQLFEDKDLRIFDLADRAESCTINPLQGGTPQEIADRLITSLEFESSYYRDVQYEAVLAVAELLTILNKPITFNEVYLHLLDIDQLSSSVKLVKEKLYRSTLLTFEKLIQMRGREREERLSGVLSQIQPFCSGELSEIVNGEKDNKPHLDLEKYVRGKLESNNEAAVVIVLLNTMMYPKQAKILGKMLMQVCAWATSKRTKEAPFLPLFIDEFSAFTYQGFEDFLNKSRSYGVALHLSHQSIGDLEKVSNSFSKTVNVNTNIKVLMGLNDPDTADYFARHLGTRTSEKSTERGMRGFWGSTEMTGDVSLREVEQYKIHPNRLKNFTNGRGVLSMMVGAIPFVEEMQFERLNFKLLNERGIDVRT